MDILGNIQARHSVEARSNNSNLTDLEQLENIFDQMEDSKLKDIDAFAGNMFSVIESKSNYSEEDVNNLLKDAPQDLKRIASRNNINLKSAIVQFMDESVEEEHNAEDEFDLSPEGKFLNEVFDSGVIKEDDLKVFDKLLSSDKKAREFMNLVPESITNFAKERGFDMNLLTDGDY